MFLLFQQPSRFCSNTIYMAACFLLMLPLSANAAEPIKISSRTEISNGDWFPLPVEDMKAAAGDTALSELSSGGIFELVKNRTVDNALTLNVSLIGPAETAKLTIEANIRNQPTYISTASISLRGLDYKGIYDALEHIGLTAAQRMNGKIEALVVAPPVTAAKPVGNVGLENSALRMRYDEAQKLKRNYQYKRARILFEQIAASNANDATQIKALAKDELRYGLTVFEAKQAMVSMGMASGDIKTVNANLTRAENLYRQVLAENRDDLLRTKEAQLALDNLLVSKNAVRVVAKAQSRSSARSVEIMMKQQFFMTFKCPDRAEIDDMSKQMRNEVSLVKIRNKGDGKAYTYRHKQSGEEFSLSCADGDIALIR
ncbi:MAG: hypothetical protein HKP12_11935 [Gammaproteobacteria bacterium]|nr:hypothetical protein [Gammaproteobacteria bacterium]